MKKHILFVVHTEYHVLIAVNQALKYYNDFTQYNVELLIRRGKNGKRLSQAHDFSNLPLSVSYFEQEVSINNPLGGAERTAVESLMKKRPDVFIFFQEQDVLMAILSYHFHKNGSEVCLYQDGLKPYNHLMFHSLGLIQFDHKKNIWLRKHGFDVSDWLSPIWSKKYGFLKGIDKIFLTFPEMYDNWNKKPLEKIEFLPLEVLNPVFKKLFFWDESYLPVRENVIFYMNQPMHDDGLVETEFLKKISQKFPDNPIYIKLHPLTSEQSISQFMTLSNVNIIRSTLPAELFIMNLSNSVILSINSTSMFLNNPRCRFFYLYKIFEKEIKRLSRWKLKKNPADHIFTLSHIDEITF